MKSLDSVPIPIPVYMKKSPTLKSCKTVKVVKLSLVNKVKERGVIKTRVNEYKY